MEVIEKREYVLFIVEDCNSVKDLEFNFEEIYFLCTENEYNRIIIDLSDMNFNIRNDTSYRFHLGLLAERHLKFNSRIAIIIDINRINSERPIATEAYNRGVNVEICANLMEAEDWVLH